MWCYGKPFSPFSRRQISNFDSHGYASYEFKLFSRMGNHIDSLAHFESNTPGLDEISLEVLHGTALVIPIKNCVALSQIRLADIEPYMDKVRPRDIVLICTGWDRMWESDTYAKETPFLSNELALWLVNKNVKLVGTDTALCCDPREGIEFVARDANISDTILLKSSKTLIFWEGIIDATPIAVILNSSIDSIWQLNQFIFSSEKNYL